MLSCRSDLTADRVRELLNYDSETGVFYWRVDMSKKVKAGQVAGTAHSAGYVAIRIKRVSFLAHRLAWLHFYGRWPADQLDHRDGIKRNNAISNLREASHSENQQNRAINRNNKSNYPGVSWEPARGKWQAQIKKGGRQVRLGRFDTPELAAEAYRAAKAEMHPFQPATRRLCPPPSP